MITIEELLQISLDIDFILQQGRQKSRSKFQ